MIDEKLESDNYHIQYDECDHYNVEFVTLQNMFYVASQACPACPTAIRVALEYADHTNPCKQIE